MRSAYQVSMLFRAFGIFAAVLIAVPAAASVQVVVDPTAPAIEQFAARELCGYLDQLFDIKITPSARAETTSEAVIVVGSAAAKAQPGGDRLSDQGILLRTVSDRGRTRLVVGGGSPEATLWAVYALAEHWGVRFLLHGDVFPEKRAFEMPRLDVIEEPSLRVRQWRVVNEHAMGPVSWGIADYKPVIDQLAKLRFNRLLIYIWPGQPFLPLEYRGIRQTSGTLFFGYRYPITPDMVGRSLFGNEKEYWNPDLPLPGGDPRLLTEAAVAHVRKLIAYAKSRGMECVMPAALTEFPREFQPLLPRSTPTRMLGTPTISPGPDADIDDPVLAGLASAVLETTLKTYPGVDYVALDVPEWRAWVGQYERAWKALDSKYNVGAVRSLDQLLAAARSRPNYPGGPDRAVSEVKGDIVALYFFDRIISQPRFKEAHKKFVINSVAEELYPILPRVLPVGSETLNFIDYTPARIVKRRNVIAQIPARQIPSVLIYTLHDDNVGVLPQLETHSLATLNHDLIVNGWAGFSTRYWLTGDHDPCVAYLARAAWDSAADPDVIDRDQVARVCGAAAVDDMLKVFSEVEKATTDLEWHGLGLSFTVPGMMMKHWTTAPLSPELRGVTHHYQAAKDAAERALKVTTPAGRAYIDYWVGRLDFGIEYMRAIESLRAAAAADSTHDHAGALRLAKESLTHATRGIEQYAAVARDRSDKGAIAVMNEYVIRPLRVKVAELAENVSHK